ncbi:Uncharacterised protein [Yersinia intermedia]|nr:Uncharacterised protein [Yersinia intermedia]
MNDFSQIRCRGSRQRFRHITTGQALYGRCCCLKTLLQRTAGAVFLHFGFVFFCLTQGFRIAFQRRIGLQRGFQTDDIPLRARDIHRLTTNLANKLRFSQPVLLFLLIKDRADAAVGVVGITAQVIDILLLFTGIADSDSAIADRRLRSTIGMTIIAQP